MISAFVLGMQIGNIVVEFIVLKTLIEERPDIYQEVIERLELKKPTHILRKLKKNITLAMLEDLDY